MVHQCKPLLLLCWFCMLLLLYLLRAEEHARLRGCTAQLVVSRSLRTSSSCAA